MAAVREADAAGPVAVIPTAGPASIVRRRRSRLEALMAGAIVLTIGGLVLVAGTGASIGVWAPIAAIALDTTLAVVVASIAAMTWVRYREHGPVRPLLQSSAFAVLCVAGIVRLGMIAGLPGRPVDGLILAWSSAQWLLAAILLLLSARPAADASELRWGRPWMVAIGPAVVSAAVAVLLLALMPASGPGPSILGDPPASLQTVPAEVDLVHLAGHLVVVGILLVAAFGYARLHAAAPNASRALLAMGLVLAAAGQAFAGLLPARVPLVVTVGDLFVMLFIACSMAGVVAASQGSLRSLREAYQELRLAREEELRRVAFAERARLAREIHDHLIQSLWLARLRQGHVLATDLPPESRVLAEEVCQALDDGLADAREAMVALDPGPDGPRPLHLVMQEGLARLIDRHDLELRVFRSGPMPALDPTVASQLLGIVREAITNSAKHADATMIRLRLIAREQELTVMVADNGNGFDPSTAPHGFGLESMQRRAAVIGAALAIDSRPLDGTRVTIQLPLGGEARA